MAVGAFAFVASGRSVTVLTVREPGNAASFVLPELLELLPELATSEWGVTGLECTGDAADAMYAIEERRQRLTGEELLALARRLLQVIDGEFDGLRGGAEWVTLRVIDGSDFDVETRDEVVVARVRARFTQVEDVTAHFRPR